MSGTGNLTSNGMTLPSLTINGSSITVTLQDDLNVSGTLTLTKGSISAGSHNVTCANFSSSNTNTRTINLGTGTWNLTGTGTVWDVSTTTGLTVTRNSGGAGTIKLSDTSTTARTFAGGGKSYSNLWITGSGNSTTTLTGSNLFTDILIDAAPRTVTFPASSTTTYNTLRTRATATAAITLNSSSSGTAASLSNNKGYTTFWDYCSIKDIHSVQSSVCYAGTHSTNVSGNANITFTNPPNALTGNQTITSSGMYWWTATADGTLKSELWGAGAQGNTDTEAVQGGAGGAYSKVNAYPVNNYYSYFVYIVAAGAVNNVADGTAYPTFLETPLTQCAYAGNGGDNLGLSNGGIGDVVYNGGSGVGCGGGSSAGTASNGTDSTAGSDSGAVGPTGSGPGGDGDSSGSGNGSNGVAPGGGGGGSYDMTGGLGAQGKAILTFTASGGGTTVYSDIRIPDSWASLINADIKMPIAEILGIQADLRTAIAQLATARLDAVATDAWVQIVATSLRIATDLLSTINADRTIPIEFISSSVTITSDLRVAIDNLAAMTRDLRNAIDNTELARADLLEPIANLLVVADNLVLPRDAAGTTRSDLQDPFAALGTVAPSGSVRFDWVGRTTDDFVVSTEELLNARRDSMMAMENLQTARTDLKLLVAWLTSINADQRLPVEWVGAAGINAYVAVPYDWVTPLRRDLTVPIDATLAARTDVVTAQEHMIRTYNDERGTIEFLQQARQDGRVAFDYPLALTEDSRIVIERLGALHDDPRFNLENLQTARVDDRIPFENQGGLGAHSDVVMPLDWTSKVIVDAVVRRDNTALLFVDEKVAIETLKVASPVDTTFRFAFGRDVHQDAKVLMEWLGISQFSSDSKLAFDWTSPVRGDARLNIEATIAAGGSYHLVVENLAKVLGIEVLPGDTLVLVNADSFIKAEWGGSSGFVEGNAVVIHIGARRSVWHIPARIVKRYTIEQ